MTDRLTYERDGAIALITMDDGKANALSPAMLSDLDAALQRAESDSAAVVLAGRPDRFSGGFDLNVIRAGVDEMAAMVRAGFEVAFRMLQYPRPLVVACTGHAIAMGCFVLLSGDYRVGADGPYRIVANEVAIGLTMPLAAVEICRQRLTPAALDRALLLAETFSPDTAVAAGFLDELAPPERVVERAVEKANELNTLDMTAHAATKQRVRAHALRAVREAIDTEFGA